MQIGLGPLVHPTERRPVERLKYLRKKMTIFVEHVDMLSINDPKPNPNLTTLRKGTRKVQSISVLSPKIDIFAIAHSISFSCVLFKYFVVTSK